MSNSERSTLSKTNDSYTPITMVNHPKQLLLTIPEIVRDINKIFIITDRELSYSQINLLNRFYSTYEIKQSDSSFHKLPDCQIYVLPLCNNILSPRRSWGSLYYGVSYNNIIQRGYTIIYYKTLDLISNVDQLKPHYKLTDFPISAESKIDLFEQLAYDSLDKHLGCLGVLGQLLCSKITINDFCGLICGSISLF